MRKNTLVFIDAIAVVFSTAIQFVGYGLAVFIFTLMITHPVVLMLFKLTLNILLALFAFSNLSDRFEQWISNTIKNIYWWFRYRPRYQGSNVIYYATFNI